MRIMEGMRERPFRMNTPTQCTKTKRTRNPAFYTSAVTLYTDLIVYSRSRKKLSRGTEVPTKTKLIERTLASFHPNDSDRRRRESNFFISCDWHRRDYAHTGLSK